jgi:hypothetical protein
VFPMNRYCQQPDNTFNCPTWDQCKENGCKAEAFTDASGSSVLREVREKIAQGEGTLVSGQRAIKWALSIIDERIQSLETR